MNYQMELNGFLTYLMIDRGLSLNTKENYERDLKSYLSFIKQQSVEHSIKLSASRFNFT